jgi:hypothetical protein
MRSEGVLDFPDPDTSGGFDKVTLGRLAAGNPRYPGAQRDCQHLLPHDAGQPDETALRHMTLQGLEFARCMRNHGVALADPGPDGRIPDPATQGIDQGSPQFQAANQACRAYRPGYMPSNAAYEAWARSQGS